MSRLIAAMLLLLGQDMPVTRLAGGVPAPAASAPASAQPPPQTAPSRSLPVTQIVPGTQAVSLDSPRRLSLTFSEPRPIDEVMRLLVAGTPFSLSIDPDASGSFRGELKQLTLREALTTMLAPLGLDFELKGTVLRVSRRKTATREFDINLLDVQRGLRRVTGEERAALTTTVNGEGAFAGIAEGIQVLLSPGGTVHVDRRAGLAQVTDYPDRLDRVSLYLEALHVRSGRQVRLQARVFEVLLRQGGAIDWRAVRDRLGLRPSSAEAGIAADPVALQAALAEQGTIRVLFAPEVTAMNNEPAFVRAGAGGAATFLLAVVPQIAADGVVQLSVMQAWEEKAGAAPARVAEADTVTRVADGNTVVIAGGLRPTDAADPGRGSAELVVLLRATVVTAGPAAAATRH